MDQVVRMIVWIALFGGTGAVVAMLLPRIVVGCLEVVAHVRARKERARTLRSPRPAPRSIARPAAGEMPRS